MFSDSKKRSLVKGISWRTVGTIDTFVLSYLIFGKVTIALPIAITEVFTKIALYYVHERIWNKVKWGRGEKKATNLRSLVKGISWRFWGTLDTMFIGFIISGHAFNSIKLGFAEVITKVLLYYLHERLWSLIRWGRKYE